MRAPGHQDAPSRDRGTTPTARVGLVHSGARPDGRLRRALVRGGLHVEELALGEVDVACAGLDVVVIESDGSPLSGNGHVDALHARFDGLPVVIISPSRERAAVERALRAGARGLVVAQDLERTAVSTVLAVAAGQLVLPGGYVPAYATSLLSAREKQVLAMVVLGFTNRDVANRLFVAETTVKSHLSSAYRKLDVTSRKDATALILSDAGLGLGILTLSGERPPT